MKRKFLSILSLVLAIAMILPMGVFVSADDTQPDPTPLKITWDDKENKDVTNGSIEVDFNSDGTTVNLTASGGNGTYDWITSSVGNSQKGADYSVTFTTPGNYTVSCISAGTTATVSVSVKKVLSGISVTKEPTKMEYYTGDALNLDGMVVEAEYNDGTHQTITDYTATPAAGTILSASAHNGQVITVKYDEQTASTTGKIKVTEKTVDKVEIVNATTKFTEGDKLPTLQVNVTFNDKTTITLTSGYKVLVNGSEVASNYTFKTTDKTIAVSYSGVSSTAVNITVAAKETETEKPSTGDTYSVTITGTLKKTTYKVGETFDPAGLTAHIKKNNTEILTLTEDDLKTVLNEKFTTVSSSTSTTGYYKFVDNGTTRQVKITISGLKVEAATETLSVYEITAVEMEEKSYPVGYSFSLSDIEYFYYRERYSSTSYKVYGYDVINKKYSNTISLEVLNSKGNTKTSYRYASVIEEDDVQTDSKGNEYVTLLLTVDSVKYKFNVDVGSSGVYYYYDDDLIAIYDDIDEALKYTAKQDDDVDFDLEDVDDDEEILIKLGEDQKISASFTLGLNHNVKIDLNGHTLTFYTDTVDITKANDDYTLIITNTSSTAGKFIYYDKDVTMTVAKNEKLVFEYDKDIPGIYTVTLDVGSNGTVTTTPKASSDEITVGHGTDIKFTITPASGYSVNTIKADSKTVSSSDYTKASNGVVTYTLKAVSKSQKVEITFKKDETKWNNPFTDVRSTDSYYSAVQFVYENELFKGTTTTKFSPDTTMTRAMFVTVLGRLANVDVSRYKTSSYSDIPLNNDTAWYAPYVEWATNMGLVEGYGDGTFGPNNKITHQQMYVLMYRYTIFVENKSVTLKSTSINASDAEDVADWAKDAVKFASQNNFLVKISTTSSRIDPTGEAKRCELAQLLEKYCSVILGWKD